MLCRRGLIGEPALAHEASGEGVVVNPVLESAHRSNFEIKPKQLRTVDSWANLLK